MRALVIALASLGPISFATAGELVGQWCDQPLENLTLADRLIRIEIRDSGPVLLDRFKNSTREVELSREGEGVFVHTEDDDGYRIVGRDLELFDELGFIRTAFRLQDDATAEECWR